jgi:hypothetical protein
MIPGAVPRTASQGIELLVQFEPVPKPGIGVNKRRSAGIWLDFLSELTDKDAKVLPFIARIGAPNGPEEPAMPDGPALCLLQEAVIPQTPSGSGVSFRPVQILPFGQNRS